MSWISTKIFTYIAVIAIVVTIKIYRYSYASSNIASIDCVNCGHIWTFSLEENKNSGLPHFYVSPKFLIESYKHINMSLQPKYMIYITMQKVWSIYLVNLPLFYPHKLAETVYRSPFYRLRIWSKNIDPTVYLPFYGISSSCRSYGFPPSLV